MPPFSIVRSFRRKSDCDRSGDKREVRDMPRPKLGGAFRLPPGMFCLESPPDRSAVASDHLPPVSFMLSVSLLAYNSPPLESVNT